MATKTIITTVAVDVPGPNFVPFQYDSFHNPTSGDYDVVTVQPGNLVTLEEADADRILAEFGGSVVPTPAVSTTGTGNTGSPQGATGPAASST